MLFFISEGNLHQEEQGEESENVPMQFDLLALTICNE